MLLKWIVPWEFSWVFLATFALACLLYWRGSRRLQVGFSRQLAFWSGMAIIYLSLHTYLDYYAEHEFFMHRLQQLLLHHLAPLLIVCAYPASVLRAGLPGPPQTGVSRCLTRPSRSALSAPRWRGSRRRSSSRSCAVTASATRFRGR